MNIQIIGELEFKILSRNGELERMFKKPMDSLLKNFVLRVLVDFNNAAQTLTKTDGTTASILPGDYTHVNAAATISAFGIVVGTGTDAVLIDNYKLKTQIAHGNLATQLYYQACTLGVYTQVGSEGYFIISRNFNNNSGSTITIQEAGLYAQYLNVATYFCFGRDLTGPIDVLNTKTLVAQYTFKVTA
jgi:hypothetical protein